MFLRWIELELKEKSSTTQSKNATYTSNSEFYTLTEQREHSSHGLLLGTPGSMFSSRIAL